MRQSSIQRFLLVFLQGLLILLLTQCTVKLIADYDEVTDKAVTALQRKVNGFLVGLERLIGTPEAAYEKHTKFYDEVRVDIDAIRVRAGARLKNEITVKQLNLVRESMNQLEELHKLGFSKVEQVEVVRKGLDIHFTAILKLELAKKR